MEKDIRILEEFLGKFSDYMVSTKLSTNSLNNIEKSLKHLIKAYKKLEEIEESHKKENGELRERVKGLEERISLLIQQNITYKRNIYDLKHNNIPVSLVKEKIEEYDKKRIKIEKDDIGVGFTLDKEWSDLKAKIQAYEELLEKRK